MIEGFDPEFAAASDWARLYRANGVQIVPCKNKSPRLKSWKEYQNALVPDAQFEAWYGPGGEFTNSYDMGMLTGTASGRILMIDLDIYKSIAAARWWLGVLAVHNNGAEIETWKQVTGGGGSQMFFTYPAGWKFAVNAKTDLNIDIRCQGGFAVLPPTVHQSGKSYVWLEGCAPWEIPIATAPDWLLIEVGRLIEEHGGGQPVTTNGGNGQTDRTTQGTFDAFGHQTDGREDKMYKMVWRVVVKWKRQNPLPVPAAESVCKAQQEYEIYERGVNPQKPHSADLTKTQKLDREERGWAVWWSKWQYAMKQWDTKVQDAANNPDPHPEDDDRKDYGENSKNQEDFLYKAKQQAKATGDIYPFLDVNQIMDKPDPVWAIDGLINERSLGFIFGPPSSLKTFIAIDLALSMTAMAASWWGRTINRHGAVVYLCREGTSSLKFRIRAWEMHRKMAARGTPFFLIEHPTNFMKAEDVGKVSATVSAIMVQAGVPIAALFVDTVSRVLPGAKENQQEDMSLFVGACEMLQHTFDCLVIGVHHTNKNGGIRGSTVIPGAGDTLIETRREPGAMSGSIFIHKVKDGEDGVELPFKVTKIDLGGIVPRSSLTVDPTEGPAQKAAVMAGKDGLPDMAVCREILGAITTAWFQAMPWSVDNSARPAVQMIMARWFLKRDAVKKLLAGWMANGVIEHADFPGKQKVKGYRKLTDL